MYVLVLEYSSLSGSIDDIVTDSLFLVGVEWGLMIYDGLAEGANAKSM